MLKIICVLIGTFIGAGFASGKEVFNFFTCYYYNGIISIFIFSLLLFLLVFKCLDIKTHFHINSYGDFLFFLEKKYRFFNYKYFLLIINIFLASSFYIMVIALSSLFYSQFNIAKLLTIFATIFTCFFIFYKKNIHFIYVINSILMPILILFIITLCLFNIDFNHINLTVFNHHSNIISAIFMGLLYFSYNSLLLIPIIFDLKINSSKKINFKISIIYALIIFILMFLINLLLLNFFFFIKDMELPILYIANSSPEIFSFFYFFIFLSAIFTTMISSGYSFVINFDKSHFNFKLILFLLFAFVFCFFSFSSLINFFYPLFGLIGFIQIFLILTNKS